MAWKSGARQKLVTDVVQSKAADAVDGMSWREFEKLVGEGFRLQGYQALESAPRPAETGRPPQGSSKVAEPHLLERPVAAALMAASIWC